MGYPIVFVLPGGILDGAEIPKKDNPLFGYSGSPTYRPGQPLSMGGPLGKTVAEYNALGMGVYDTPAQDLDVTQSILKPKRIWDEATQTIIVDTAKDVLHLDEFVDRFTESEWENVMDLLESNQGAVKRKAMGAINYFSMRRKIDPENQRVIDAMNWLETQGAIGPGRAAQILS